jgi:hypothetical protein
MSRALGIAVLLASLLPAWARADEPGYVVAVEKVAAQKGRPAVGRVTIRATAGHHVNAEFPSTLVLTPPAGVTAAKPTLRRADATVSETELTFRPTLSSQVSALVPATVRFAVCTPAMCEPRTASVVIDLALVATR